VGINEEKTINSTEVFRGKVLNLRVDTVLLPNGLKSRREIVEHNGGGRGGALTPGGGGGVLPQYPKPADEVLWELPAGRLEAGEDVETAFLREMREEIGLVGGRHQKLLSFYSTPGFCSEILHLFLIVNAEIGESHPDPDENIIVEKIPLKAALEMVERGEIRDGKTIVGLLMAERMKGSAG